MCTHRLQESFPNYYDYCYLDIFAKKICRIISTLRHRRLLPLVTNYVLQWPLWTNLHIMFSRVKCFREVSVKRVSCGSYGTWSTRLQNELWKGVVSAPKIMEQNNVGWGRQSFRWETPEHFLQMRKFILLHQTNESHEHTMHRHFVFSFRSLSFSTAHYLNFRLH